jgi:hypothetical protein
MTNSIEASFWWTNATNPNLGYRLRVTHGTRMLFDGSVSPDTGRVLLTAEDCMRVIGLYLSGALPAAVDPALVAQARELEAAAKDVSGKAGVAAFHALNGTTVQVATARRLKLAAAVAHEKAAEACKLAGDHSGADYHAAVAKQDRAQAAGPVDGLMTTR